MWAHDHRFFFTAENVYKGALQMINYYSGPDRGNETLADGVNLMLPSGSLLDSGNLDFDVNLIVSDSAFDPTGQYFFDIFDTDGFLEGVAAMIARTTTVRSSFALAATIAGGLSLAAPAYAGACPADKLRPDGSGEKMNAAPAKDVGDTVLTSIDLANEPAAVKDRLLRLRRLEIKPGGVVPWHAHANRPAIIYIVQGEIVEYASTCAVPIVHRAGEAATETHATAHWWKEHRQPNRRTFVG